MPLKVAPRPSKKKIRMGRQSDFDDYCSKISYHAQLILFLRSISNEVGTECTQDISLYTCFKTLRQAKCDNMVIQTLKATEYFCIQ